MPERIDAKFSWVADGAAERTDGRGPEDIEYNAWLAVAEITDDRQGMSELLGTLFDVDPDRRAAVADGAGRIPGRGG